MPIESSCSETSDMYSALLSHAHFFASEGVWVHSHILERWISRWPSGRGSRTSSQAWLSQQEWAVERSWFLNLQQLPLVDTYWTSTNVHFFFTNLLETKLRYFELQEKSHCPHYFHRWDYFQVGDKLYKEMDHMEAYKIALTTWANWVDSNIDPAATKVFFQGISAVHYR